MRIVSLEKVPAPRPESRIGAGEAVLLAYSPVFKIRYAADGDLLLGCTVGCRFCYYRMIGSTRPFIGTGVLAHLATPEEFVEMLRSSRLLRVHPLVILGARGDASMYPGGVERVAYLVDREGLGKTLLALRRPPFTREVAEQLLSYGDILRYGTTITPAARETGTPVTEESQLAGLERIAGMGVEPRLVSVEVGPITPRNVTRVYPILQRLREIGFRAAVYRGVSAGSYNIPRREVLEELYRSGFLPEELYRRALESRDYFYAVKNTLLPAIEEAVLNMFREAGLRPYRHTGLFYALEWGIPVAYSRGNTVRGDVYSAVAPVQGLGTAAEVKQLLETLGYHVTSAEELRPGVVRVSTVEPVTEDVAMTVGAATRTAIIADNYMKSPDLGTLKFYIEAGLLRPPERSLRVIRRLHMHTSSVDVAG